MKAENIVKVTTEGGDEHKFVLEKFPGIHWVKQGDTTVFFVDNADINLVHNTVNKWNERMEKK